MKSRSSLRTTSRRGFSVVEAVIAASLTLIVTAALASLLSTSGRMQQTVSLQTDADTGSVLAMNRMIVEVREAKDVSIISSHRFRVFFPYMMSNGHYDRFQLNSTDWVEYYQSDRTGNPDANGAYLARRTNTQAAVLVADDIRALRIVTNSPRSVRLTVEMEKKHGEFSGSTRLTERVLYLRNS